MKQILIWLLACMLGGFAGGAAAQDVRLGAGDILKISVYNNPDLSLETRVTQSGSISYPLIGEVAVGGLTTADAEKRISGMLEGGGFVRDAQVNIIVSVFHSQQVSVLGQVNRPGRYPVEGKRNLTDVLALAGGISPEGGDTITIVRKREGKSSRQVIDLVEMMRSGDMQQNLDLASDDVIYVERAPRFYIYGEVQRPGMFRLERDMTVVQALSAGGGLSMRGTERRIRIKRRDAEGKLQVLPAEHDDLLQTNDVVYVQESLF